MAPAEPPTSITLKLKVPPGSQIAGGSDDFIFGSIATSASIGDLRAQIQERVPSHPAPETQRLLYAGRALVDNAQTVADALNTRRDPTQTEYVVHLLVKGEGMTGAPSAGQTHRRATSTPQAAGPQAANVPSLQPHQAPHAHGHPGNLHHQQHHAVHQQEVMRQMAMQQQLAMQHAAQAQRNAGFGAPFPSMPQQQLDGSSAPPNGLSIPPPGMRAGFGQFVAQGQQQRAAAGMHGVGGPPNMPGMPFNGIGMPPPPPGVQPAQVRMNVNITRTATPGQGVPQSNTEAQHEPSDTTNENVPSDEGEPAPPQQQQDQNEQAQNRQAAGQSFTLPDGRRVTIGQRASISIPQLGIDLPIQNIIPQISQLLQQRGGVPTMPDGQPIPPQPAQPRAPAPPGTSALDRARDNLAEMRRTLDEIRTSADTTDEQRARLANLGERAQSLNDYIDPMRMHGVGGTRGADAGRRSAPPNIQPHQNPAPPSLFGQRPVLFPPRQPSPFMPNFGLPGPLPIPQSQFRPNFMPSQQFQPTNSTNPTCYLLSGPQGPQALLFSPQHGTYTSSLARAPSALRPTPTTTPAAHPPQQQLMDQRGEQAPGGDAVAATAANVVPNAQQQQQQQRPAAQDALQPILNHLWLLLRVLIFTYFLLGSNMGWRRPAALMAIGIGFWMVRAGLFGDGGVARRWWDGIMGVPAAAQPAQAPAAGAEGERGGRPQQQRIPTPEEVAQRLIDQRNEAQNVRLRQVREFVWPVERAVALFVASLWPGVGEAAVRLREEEERRAREEEVEANRRREEEAERVRKEQEEKEKEQSGEEEGKGEIEGPADVLRGEDEKAAQTTEVAEAGGQEDRASVSGA